MKNISLKTIGRFFIAIIFLYVFWFRDVWGDRPIILYGAVLISSIIMLIDIFNFRANTPKPPMMLFVFLAFGVYSLCTGVLVAIDKNAFFSQLKTYFAYVLVAYECWYFSLDIGVNWLCHTAIIIAFVCAVQTILWGQPYFNEVYVTTMSSLNNPNSLGFAMILGITAIIFKKKWLDKAFIICFMGIALFLYVIILSGSRKALLGSLILIVPWLIFYFFEHIKEGITLKILARIFFMISVISLLIIIGISTYKNSASFQRLLFLFGEDGTALRSSLYLEAFEYWKESPVIGIGFNQFIVRNGRLHSHSTYGEILSCTGLLGMLLFFIPVIKIGVDILVYRKKVNHPIDSTDSYLHKASILFYFEELFLWFSMIAVYCLSHMISIIIIDILVKKLYEGARPSPQIND